MFSDSWATVGKAKIRALQMEANTLLDLNSSRRCQFLHTKLKMKSKPSSRNTVVRFLFLYQCYSKYYSIIPVNNKNANETQTSSCSRSNRLTRYHIYSHIFSGNSVLKRCTQRSVTHLCSTITFCNLSDNLLFLSTHLSHTMILTFLSYHVTDIPLSRIRSHRASVLKCYSNCIL